MAEISSTSSVTVWPSTSVVHSSDSGKQSLKQNHKDKKNNEPGNELGNGSADNLDSSLDDSSENPKKKSSTSIMNSHIDEYA